MAFSVLFLLAFFVLAFGFGSLFLYLRRPSNRLEGGMDREVLARILEDVDQLSNRLNRVEEEMDFFKELRGPGAPDRLPAPPDDSKEKA